MNSYEENKNAQSRLKSTVLRRLCALRKTGARLFAQIKACTSIKRKNFYSTARKATLISCEHGANIMGEFLS